MKTKTITIKMAELNDGGTCGSCGGNVPISNGPLLFADDWPLCNACGKAQAPVLFALLELGNLARFAFAESWAQYDEAAYKATPAAKAAAQTQ